MLFVFFFPLELFFAVTHAKSLWPYTYSNKNNLFIFFSQVYNINYVTSLPRIFPEQTSVVLKLKCLELNSAHCIGNKFLKPNLVLWLIPEHLHLPYTSPIIWSPLDIHLLLHSLLFSFYPQILCLPWLIPLPFLDDFTHFSGFSSTQISLKCIFRVGSYTYISDLYQKSPAAELRGTSNVHILNLWSTFFLFLCIQARTCPVPPSRIAVWSTSSSR